MNKYTNIVIVGLLASFASLPLAQAQTSLEYANGPRSSVTAAEIDAIKAWSRNAQTDISRLQNLITQITDGSDLKRKLFNGMETIVGNSEPNTSDLLLRHAIYAGLTVSKLIDRESIRLGVDHTPEGTVDQQVRILRKSLAMASEYYESDFAFINGAMKDLSSTKTFNPKFVEFGTRFAKFLMEMSDGVLDASSAYGMMRWSLGVLENYLTRDSRSIAYASTIKHLHNELRQYPDIVNGKAVPNDWECIRNIRELKRLGRQAILEVEKTTKTIQN